MRASLVLVLLACGTARADKISDWPPRERVTSVESKRPPARATKHTCDVAAGYTFSFGASPTPRTPELHTVHVYEAENRSTGKSRVFTLDLDRPGPVYLDLSAYEPVEWKVVATPQTKVVAVKLHGYHLQTVTGIAADTTVFAESAEKGREIRGPTRGWPNALPTTSSADCYHMTALELR